MKKKKLFSTRQIPNLYLLDYSIVITYVFILFCIYIIMNDNQFNKYPSSLDNILATSNTMLTKIRVAVV